jgi:hypothetical protein
MSDNRYIGQGFRVACLEKEVSRFTPAINRDTLSPFPEILRELVSMLDSGRAESWAVLAYLAESECKEPDVWLRDDIRVAWLCALYASHGVENPWGYAFWWYYGKTYPKALLAWAERDRENQRQLERCAAMVREQELYVSARKIVSSPPKTSPASVKRGGKRGVA